MNLPNKLTLFRIILIPVLVILLLLKPQDSTFRLVATAVFIVGSITDFLDGFIARKYHLVTNFGKFMDPLADKLLVNSALICLTALGEIPAWAVVIIIARDFIINGFRMVASDNNIVIAADMWGKFKTTFQMIMIIVFLSAIKQTYVILVGNILLYIAVALTIISLIDCIVKNKKVFEIIMESK